MHAAASPSLGRTPAQDEPSDYSIEDLEREGTAEWDGVRNYQARNVMERMRVGNQVRCCS